jgi:predicted esterase
MLIICAAPCSAIAKNYEPTFHSLCPFTIIPSAYPTRYTAINNYRLNEFIQKLHTESVPDRAYVCADKKPYITTLVRRDIPSPQEASTLLIFSRGYAKKSSSLYEMPRIGGGLYNAHQYVCGGAIFMPCVTFDYPDDAKYFNFGQDIDQACLEVMYAQVKQVNPTAELILFGDCRGAHSVLRFLTKHPEASDTIILASPLVSARDLIERISSSYLWMLGGFGPNVLKNFMGWYFPNYNPHKDDLEQHLHLIKGKRIFIGHRLGDKVISDNSVYRLARALRENNEVYLFLTHDNKHPHSRLYDCPPFSRALNAFYARYNLPYDPLKAPVGKRSLIQAEINARKA